MGVVNNDSLLFQEIEDMGIKKDNNGVDDEIYWEENKQVRINENQGEECEIRGGK